MNAWTIATILLGSLLVGLLLPLPKPRPLRLVNAVPLAELEALAARWEAEAAEEVGDEPPEWQEVSREGLAASILEDCARQLRQLAARYTPPT